MNRAATLALALLVPSLAAAVPLEIPHQGRLIDSAGAPLESTHSLDLILYSTSAGGTELWSDTFSVSFDNGYFDLILGAGTPLDLDVFNNDELYLGMSIDGGTELPERLQLASVPFALVANGLTDGAVLDVSELRVDGTTVIDSTGAITAPVSWSDITDVPDELGTDTLADLLCASGDVSQWDGSAWGCVAANTHEHEAAAITSGKLDIDRLPVGDDDESVASGAHQHSADAITTGTLDAARLPQRGWTAESSSVDPGDYVEVTHGQDTALLGATVWADVGGTVTGSHSISTQECSVNPGQSLSSMTLNSNTTLDTTQIYYVDDFTITSNATVTAVGDQPLRIYAQGDIVISGTLLLNGEDGTDTSASNEYVVKLGGAGGAGGYEGGGASYNGQNGGNGFGLDGAGQGAGQGAGYDACGDGNGGSGGGHASQGGNGLKGSSCGASTVNGGASSNSINVGTLVGGSGGGGGAQGNGNNASGSSGGGGGGAALFVGTNISVTGSIQANGGRGGDQLDDQDGGNGGGGAGGALWFRGDDVDLAGSVSATGGRGGQPQSSGQGGRGGAGANGRIRVDSDSYRGSASPTPDVTDDLYEAPCITTVTEIYELVQPDSNTVRAYNRSEQALGLKLIVIQP